MARKPTKIFELEVAPLWPNEINGVPGQEIAQALKDHLGPDRFNQIIDQIVVPLGLRWRMNPRLGLPRIPFLLLRRDNRRKDQFDFSIKGDPINNLKIGNQIYRLPTLPAYILMVSLENTSSSNVTINALHKNFTPILLQTVNIPAKTRVNVRFQHPFIGGFSFSSSAVKVHFIGVVTMQNYCNRNDWELIERVGLPVDEGEITGYSTTEQGHPNFLKVAPEAAIDRLAIAQYFYQPLESSLPGGEQLPVWEIPHPFLALEELREGKPPLLERIAEMFKAVDSRAINAQQDFYSKISGKGIHQAESPASATSNVTFEVPLLASILFNSSVDPWFALTSGFGTTDFPELGLIPGEKEYLEPASYFTISHDYMISSGFLFYPSDDPMQEEFCALSHRSTSPTVNVLDLKGKVHHQNRPQGRDDPYSADTAITWKKVNHLQIQGNAIAFSQNQTNGTYLNDFRNSRNNLPALFVPTIPGKEGDQSLLNINRFIDAMAPLPFTGAIDTVYGVATMDAFARWSGWESIILPLEAPLPQAPALIALSFSPDMSRRSGQRVPYTLEAEITWDWQDRSPNHFELAGVFHRRLYLENGERDNGHNPPESYPAFFQKDNAKEEGAYLELLFNSNNNTSIPPGFDELPEANDQSVTIALMLQNINEFGQNTDGEMRRYRIQVNDVFLTFQPNEEWFFTLFIKGAEWRQPNLLSDSTLPIPPGRPPRLTAFIPNPIPPPPPFFEPADVLWSTLPDARGRSRYRLHFDPVPGATGGYAIFQAFETKLRDLVDLPLRSGADLVGRATELRDIAMPDVRSLDAFGRLNTNLIPPPPSGAKVEYEVEIPGTLESIVVFAVASFSRAQESSSLSTPWLFVAVPRRSVPTAPVLNLIEGKDSLSLRCNFYKSPFKPSRVEVLQARRSYPAESVNTMGRAKHVTLEPEWEGFDETGKVVTDEEKVVAYRFTVQEDIKASWFPYYYRAVAIGRSDDNIGLVPGRSSQSNLITINRPPKQLPIIEDLNDKQLDFKSVLIQFTSDAPVETTPYGTFRLTIQRWDFDLKRFIETAIHDEPFSNAQLLSSGKMLAENLYYMEIDKERKQFSIRLKVKQQDYLFRLLLKDPLNRQTVRNIKGEIKENEKPNLENLRVQVIRNDIKVFFNSSTSITPPSFGAYRLEISHLRVLFGRGTTLLLRINLHDIAFGNLDELERNKSATIFRALSKVSQASHLYGAYFRNVLPRFIIFRGEIRVRLTAPDGSFALLEVNI